MMGAKVAAQRLLWWKAAEVAQLSWTLTVSQLTPTAPGTRL